MAFINDEGKKISYECSSLIEELAADIAEFGGDTLFEVVTTKREGVTLYTDYNFIEDDQETQFELKKDEKMTCMSGTALMMLLKQQNEIF